MRICEKFAAVTAFRFRGPSPLPEERENRRLLLFQSEVPGHNVRLTDVRPIDETSLLRVGWAATILFPHFQ